MDEGPCSLQLRLACPSLSLRGEVNSMPSIVYKELGYGYFSGDTAIVRGIRLL
jgi:hypothetical protein